nr:hypothetical protein [Candidatus Neomarinimicrobiota bacterium]
PLRLFVSLYNPNPGTFNSRPLISIFSQYESELQALSKKKINAVITSINRNTSQEQSENERSNSPSVRGDWSQGSYEERQIAKLYQKKKTNKKSSSDDDKSDNDSDD